MTPGTINGRRKNVTFGKEVLDNEGKKPIQSTKTGLPNDLPGKFPSPFTPKVKEPGDTIATTKAVQNAKIDSHTPVRLKPRAKDDTDVTLDVMDPRSQSGRYWKEHFDTYSAQSEKQVRKLIAKQKLAKDFAKKKDAEATELRIKLDDERKKNRTREKSWDEQMKDMQKRLRTAMADNSRYAAEIALLRQQLETVAHGKTDERPLEQLSTSSSKLPKLTLDESYSEAKHNATKKESAPVQQSESKLNKIQSTHVSENPQSIKLQNPSPSATLTSKLLRPQPQQPDPELVLTMQTSSTTPKDAPTSHPYRVSKRPITVTTARTRTAQSSSNNEKGAERQHTRPRRNREVVIAEAVEKDHSIVIASSELDLWNVADIESSHLSHKERSQSAKKGRFQPEVSKGIVVAHTKEPSRTTTMNHKATDGSARPSTEPKGITSTAKHTPTLSDPFAPASAPPGWSQADLKVFSKHNASPKHFPGTPDQERQPLRSSIANPKTNLAPTEEAAAKARIAARRAERRKARDKGGSAENKENGLVM